MNNESDAPTMTGQSPTKTATEINMSSTKPEIKTEINETVQINRKEWEDVQARLKMLYEVADKGRIMNYESQQKTKKPFQVHLSKYLGGIIVGWRTIKDQAIYHPTTGKQVGEEQEYELLIDKEGKVEKAKVNGYPAFTEARYTERIECEVRSRKVDFEDKTTFDVALPNGRILSMDAKFVN